MMRTARFSAVLALSSLCLGSSVTYMRLERNVIEKRVKTVPRTQRDALDRLRAQFTAVGIAPRELTQQSVEGGPPNLIARIPGTKPGTIIVAAPSSIAKERDRAAVQWRTLELLPCIAESLLSVVTEHTIVFLAYSSDGKSTAGWDWYLNHLGADTGPITLISLRDMGANSVMYHADAGSQALAEQVSVSAQELKMKTPLAWQPEEETLPQPSGEVAPRAIQFFAGGKAYRDRAWMHFSDSRVKPESYYDAYQLLAVFLLDVDRRDDLVSPR